MNIQNIYRLIILVGVVALSGCGGGGGSSDTPAPTPTAKTTTTISGKVEFPSLSSLVAKQVAGVASVVTDTSVSVQAYTLEGVAVGTAVTPTYEDTVAGALTDFTKRSYSYSLPDIPIGKDYIVKAKRVENGKTQELKKLIEKTDVILDPVIDQGLNSVSTAAVIVASQKLTNSMGITGIITLGDPLPPLGANTVANLSDAIVTDVAPKSLEASIQTAKEKVTLALADPAGIGAYLSSMTPEDKKALADLVNMLNIVVASVANNTDPAKVLAGTSTVDLTGAAPGSQLKLLSVDTGGTIGQATTATTSITQTVIQDTVTSAVVTYVPPRVKLELSTDSTSLYGLVFDVTIPADAKVRVDATGKLDMALLTVPSGVSVIAQYSATTRKIRIAVASANPLPAKFVAMSFDRALGKTLTSADFTVSLIETSDKDGNPSTQFSLTKTVTSSGS